jgi:hypothetical protein
MVAAKRIMRYMRATTDYGLQYTADSDSMSSDVTVSAYCDADWGGDLDDRKSTTGFCVFINGNIVSWATKKQPTVALSSAEAELMAIVEVVKEVMWYLHVLTEMKRKVRKPIIINVDNQSSMKISENDTEHDRSKHIDIKHHFVREQIKSGIIKLQWVSTTEQLADIFTKPLGTLPFTTLRDRLMKRVKVNEQNRVAAVNSKQQRQQ